MNRRTTIATAAVAAGAAALLLAPPAAAATGMFGAPAAMAQNATVTACPFGNGDAARRGPNATGLGQGGQGRWGDGSTSGMGQGMRGPANAANLPAQGTLTDTQRTELAAMAEEEKLAHDVYVALADATGDRRFTRVAVSEQRHLDAVRVLLDRYDVADPTAGKPAGTFATSEVQSAYEAFVARGKVSLDAALAVGRDIETADIADLRAAVDGLTSAADVEHVYGNLLDGSQRHLAAFGG